MQTEGQKRCYSSTKHHASENSSECKNTQSRKNLQKMSAGSERTVVPKLLLYCLYCLPTLPSVCVTWARAAQALRAGLGFSLRSSTGTRWIQSSQSSLVAHCSPFTHGDYKYRTRGEGGLFVKMKVFLSGALFSVYTWKIQIQNEEGGGYL